MELNSRDQILSLLRTRGGMSAGALAKALGITPMGVHRHLTALARDGMVMRELRRRPVGRPEFVFKLSGSGYDTFPKNYHVLANQLLDVIQAKEGTQKVDTLFAGRMEQLYSQYRSRMAGKDLASRVAELARIQEEAGYMAVWEQVEGGFILREQNCAIFRVACRFQQACQYEIELFRRLLDADITRLDHQVKGDLACVYLVRDRLAQPLSGARISSTAVPGSIPPS